MQYKLDLFKNWVMSNTGEEYQGCQPAHTRLEWCDCPLCDGTKKQDSNKISMGDKFICISDVVMDDGDTTYRAGVIYTSHNNECITDDNGERLHYWSYDNEDDDNWVDYFQRYEDCGRVRPDKDYFQSMQEEYGREPGHVGVYEGTELLISHECDALKELLISKNRAYGDSALKNGVLFDISPVEAIKARINDKAMRIKNVGLNDSTEDTLQDIMGYMVLLRIAIKQQQI